MFIPRIRYRSISESEDKPIYESQVPPERYEINRLNRVVIRTSSVLVNGGEALSKLFKIITESNAESLQLHQKTGRLGMKLYGRLGRFTTDNTLAWQVGYQCPEDLLGLDLSKNSYGLYIKLQDDLTLNVELPKMLEIPHGESGKDNVFHNWRLESKSPPKFLMSETEITKAQYLAVLGYDSSDDSPLLRKTIWRLGLSSSWDFLDQATRPVNSCTWYDIVLFCNNLSKLQGLPPYYKISEIKQVEDDDLIKVGTDFAKVEVLDRYGCGYRVPKGVEWEYAANCQRPFNFSGSNDLDEIAWYFDNVQNVNDVYAKRVKEKKPNAWGLYDMTGNVAELVSDRADPVIPKILVTKGGNVTSQHPVQAQDYEGNSYYSYSISELLTLKKGTQVRDEGSLYTGFRVCRTVYPNTANEIKDPLDVNFFQKTFKLRGLRYDVSKLTRVV